MVGVMWDGDGDRDGVVARCGGKVFLLESLGGIVVSGADVCRGSCGE